MNYRLSILAAFVCLVGCGGPRMERVRVSPDKKSFVLSPSGVPFHPWGHNYASQGLEDPSERPWQKIESDLVDLKSIGANVIRIHLQFPKFMDGPAQPNSAALARLAHLLKLAEKHGIYLDITGLACYRKDQRASWYDALSDHDRWAAQASFWEAVARACAASPAVFCYDLMNEPILFGTRKEGWYTGELGGYEFLQRLSLDQASRPRDDVTREWTRAMVAAIRKRDSRHLITIGLLPAWGLSQHVVGPELDFIAVHIYPEAGKIPAAIANLKRFDIGKPIVIEETFPLSCGVPDEREFLLQSRSVATGWIGHFPDDSLARLRSLKQSKQIAATQAAYLGWIDLFIDIGPQMLGGK